MSATPSSSVVAQALGRIPTGLYVVTTQSNGQPIGFVGSFLMQVGFEPPTLCIAVGKDRPHLAAMRENGRFGVSVLDKGSENLMGRFFRKLEPGENPFDGLAVARAAGGSTVLEGALAWFECRWSGEHATGDHVVVFGEISEAKLCRSGDPSIHLRKNGLAY